MAFNKATLPNILCCLCGTSIQPNSASMCLSCVRTQVDITEQLSSTGNIFQCRDCLRYMRGGKSWLDADWESRELLAFTLKKIHNLNKVKLVDAAFIWTEPHSRRIKVRVTVRQEVLGGTLIQQTKTVEFTIHNQQCNDCAAQYQNFKWKSKVQIRQKVGHKRTLLHLEQLLAGPSAGQLDRGGRRGRAARGGGKSKLSHLNNMEVVKNGLDFMFGDAGAAQRFTDFVASELPVRTKKSKHLVGQDNHSNISHFQYSALVELPLVCRNDICLLPRRLAAAVGASSSRDGAAIWLVLNLTSNVHLINPLTLQKLELGSERYWRDPFGALLGSRHLVEFVVLDVEPVDEGGQGQGQQQQQQQRRQAKHKRNRKKRSQQEHEVEYERQQQQQQQLGDSNSSSSGGAGLVPPPPPPSAAAAAGRGGEALKRSRDFVLVDVEVARASDFGVTDEYMRVRCHLGAVLSAGDTVLGYDLRHANLNLTPEQERLVQGGSNVPDVILVQKKYERGQRKRRGRRRGGNNAKPQAGESAVLAASGGRSAREAADDQRDFELFQMERAGAQGDEEEEGEEEEEEEEEGEEEEEEGEEEEGDEEEGDDDDEEEEGHQEEEEEEEEESEQGADGGGDEAVVELGEAVEAVKLTTINNTN